jgi:hypothetical protein
MVVFQPHPVSLSAAFTHPATRPHRPLNASRCLPTALSRSGHHRVDPGQRPQSVTLNLHSPSASSCFAYYSHNAPCSCPSLLHHSNLPPSHAVAGVVSQRHYQDLDVTELTLVNGLKVSVKHTDFFADEVVITAIAVGGLSEVRHIAFPRCLVLVDIYLTACFIMMCAPAVSLYPHQMGHYKLKF